MRKKKILLLTNHLYAGGVDRVAVDIANGLDKEKFDVTLMILFRFAPENFRLDPRVRLIKVFGGYFKGFSSLLRRLPPQWLYRRLIKESYDYEVAFQAGVPTWLLSHSPSKAVKYAWMHGLDMDHAQEHNRFDRVVFVSEEVKNTFAPLSAHPDRLTVCYNPMDWRGILERAEEPLPEKDAAAARAQDGVPVLCSVGRLSPEKGYLRLLQCHKALLDQGISQRLWLVGEGEERPALERFIAEQKLSGSVVLWGYQNNPYRFMAAADIYVCSSFNEGFNVAATEALLLEKPVVSTAVCGARELLGDDAYGIVADNDQAGLLAGLTRMLQPETRRHYEQMAKERGAAFCRVDRMACIEELFA